MVGTITLKRRFVPRYWRLERPRSSVGACYIAIIIAAGLVLPAVNEVPDEFPAVVLWKFRIAALWRAGHHVDDARLAVRSLDAARVDNGQDARLNYALTTAMKDS